MKTKSSIPTSTDIRGGFDVKLLDTPEGKALSEAMQGMNLAKAIQLLNAYDNYIKSKQIRQPAKKETICECGHGHNSHAPTRSHNYSAGKCNSCTCKNFLLANNENLNIANENKLYYMQKFKPLFYSAFMHEIDGLPYNTLIFEEWFKNKTK